MKIFGLLANEAVLAEIGKRAARRRLDLQLTQATVAEQAGIAKRTLERLEAGHSVQMSSLVRILRVLDGFSGLDRMIPEAGPEPVGLPGREDRVRQRAPRRRPSDRPERPWARDDG